jgi:micrococcal nuclease
LALGLSIFAVFLAACALIVTIVYKNEPPQSQPDRVVLLNNSHSKTSKTPSPEKVTRKAAAPAPVKYPEPAPVKADVPAPKVETPKVEVPAPKVEAPKVEVPAPKVEAPKVDSPDGVVRMEPEGRTRKVKVVGVIDGDTLRIFGGEKIRLIGINTPEKKEPLCAEATDLLRKYATGKEVTLAFDKEEKDRYGRTLAFVFSEGVFVNAEIVRQGLAFFYEFKPNVRYSKLFLKMQRDARSKNKGLWTQKPKLESEYTSSRKSARFHRPQCKRGPRKSKLRFGDRNEALDTGRSPCPDCKP